MKTISYIYTGPDVHLGRFGAITKGTPLPLDPKEAADVAKDSRFKRSTTDLFPLKFEPAKPAANETDAEKSERIKSDANRSALYDHLNGLFERNEKEK